MKSGSYFTLTDVRTNDAWGNVRSGAQAGRPRARYCANLGHVQDDESGLVYMRARYYEPSSGRFVSEDPGANGDKWYSYAQDNPVAKLDANGCFTLLGIILYNTLIGAAVGGGIELAAQVLGSAGTELEWADVWIATWQGAVVGCTGAGGAELKSGMQAASASAKIGQLLEDLAFTGSAKSLFFQIASGIAKGLPKELSGNISASGASGAIWCLAVHNTQIIALLGAMDLD